MQIVYCCVQFILFCDNSIWYIMFYLSRSIFYLLFTYLETIAKNFQFLIAGVLHEHMTLIWCLSPLIGFFLTPIMGSLSDRCKSNLGRRRPFIILLSIGVVLGKIFMFSIPKNKWFVMIIHRINQIFIDINYLALI